MTVLLKNACVYTPQGVIEGGYVAVDGAVIVSVGAERPEGAFDCEKDMSGKLLLPGLVNAHTHAAMTLLRGVGTDLPLQKWLFDSVFPVEGRMTAEDIRAGTALALRHQGQPLLSGAGLRPGGDLRKERKRPQAGAVLP